MGVVVTSADATPGATLERKLTELSGGLTDDERSIFLAILAIAATADEPEVTGLTMRRSPSAIGQGAELSMVELQSLVSRRAAAIQLASSMMMSMNDSTQSIVKNIRG